MSEEATVIEAKVDLAMGQDPGGFLKFGVIHDGVFIHDIFRSQCGNYGVDPEETYGVPAEAASEIRRMNETVAHATAIAARATEQAITAALNDGKDVSTGLFDADRELRASLAGTVAACLAHALFKRGVGILLWDPSFTGTGEPR